MLATVAQGLFDLSRGRQALLSVAQPGLGALLALGGLPDRRTLLIGIAAATAGYLAVFSLNDVLDLRSDVEALKAGKGEFEGFDLDTAFMRHPVAVGRLRLSVAVAWVSALATIAVGLAWMLGPFCVAAFGASVSLEVVYCALRSRSWLKTIVSGVMVALGGLAGWVAVAPLSWRAAGFFAFLALWEIAGRNIPNDLADLAADARVALRTVPTTFGPRVAARAVLAGSALTVVSVSALPLAPLQLALAVGAGFLSMVVPSIRLASAPTSAQAGRYFNVASLLPALVFAAVLGTDLLQVRP